MKKKLNSHINILTERAVNQISANERLNSTLTARRGVIAKNLPKKKKSRTQVVQIVKHKQCDWRNGIKNSGYHTLLLTIKREDQLNEVSNYIGVDLDAASIVTCLTISYKFNMTVTNCLTVREIVNYLHKSLVL